MKPRCYRVKVRRGRENKAFDVEPTQLTDLSADRKSVMEILKKNVFFSNRKKANIGVYVKCVWTEIFISFNSQRNHWGCRNAYVSTELCGLVISIGTIPH